MQLGQREVGHPKTSACTLGSKFPGGQNRNGGWTHVRLWEQQLYRYLTL